MEKKSNKEKGKIALVILAVVILVAVVVVTIAIVGALKDSVDLNKNEDTSLYSLSGVTNSPTESAIDGYFASEEVPNSENAGDTDVVLTQNSFDDGFVDVEENAGDEHIQTTEETTEYNPLEAYETLSKNGENQLSDHHDNKFIKLVAEKYGVDKELLVAIYSEPNTGNNFVLEFSGKRNDDGNVIKSPETLVKVYSIDKKNNICVATGKTTGNVGVSYAEGMLCFSMIKAVVMPQYPEYFSGVDK